ncbi:MAG TPA: divalent metal cation transporter, partial [Armatimonadota bacterium]|nr:divalent metal cation transporter [Armatimonadota bacterium]
GAADDDPSGISTYSIAGASLGYGLLWTPLFSFPLMTAVQLMCARLGLVCGQGLAAVLRRRYPRPVLWTAALLLLVANTVNIGADLGGMGAVMQLMTGIRAAVWTPLFAVLIVSLLIWCSYRYLARVFKWLTLALFSYVIAAFFAHPKWGDVLRATFIPRLASDQNYLATFVGIMGTTISPYLFFWQAAEEVEEERAHGQRTLRSRRGATRQELSSARNDVLAGMLLSNVVMYFIILTAGATLHQAGITHLETAGEAARALRPLAGDTAYLLFTLGLIGTGMLGVPVLAGSAAYAVAEAMHWRGSLDDRPSVAPQFYAVLVVSVFLGLGLDFLKINAVQALFWAAIVNGVLAPPLVVLVTLVTSDPRVMGEHVNPLPLRVLGWFTALVMGAAAVGLVVTARG